MTNVDPTARPMTAVVIFHLQQQLAELTEMLTAATDTAVQRGKRIDELEAQVTRVYDLIDPFDSAAFLDVETIRQALEDADGG